jgi:hypothetical protein
VLSGHYDCAPVLSNHASPGMRTSPFAVLEKSITAPSPAAAATATDPAETARGRPGSAALRHSRLAGSANEPAFGELTATWAVSRVTDDEGRALTGRRKLFTNLSARCLACSAACDQRVASLEDIRLDLCSLTTEDLRNLCVGKTAQLSKQQCRSVRFSDLLEVSEQVADLRPSLGGLEEVGGRSLVELSGWILSPVTDDGEATVPRDGEEPRFELEVSLALPQLSECHQEGVLNDIFGIRDRAEPVAGEPKKWAGMSFVDRLKRPSAPAPGRCDEPVVTQQTIGARRRCQHTLLRVKSRVPREWELRCGDRMILRQRGLPRTAFPRHETRRPAGSLGAQQGPRKVSGQDQQAPPRCANSRGHGTRRSVLMQFSAYARTSGAV